MEHNNEENIRRLAPVIAKAFQLGKEQKYNEAYQTLLPLFEAKEQLSYFEEPCGWAIYRYLKQNEETLSSLDIRKALSYYLSFASCKPSILHSCIMIQAVNLEKNHENDFRFIDFCLMWHLDSLRDEDFELRTLTSTDGRNMEFNSLAEGIVTRLYKEMESRHTVDYVDKLLPFFILVRERCPQNKFISRYIAKLYYWGGHVEKAICEYKTALLTHPEWYIWKDLGDVVEDEDLRISCYCKALTMNGQEDFIGELRLNLASLLIAKNPEQAAYEIDKYMSTYQKNQWRICGDAYIMQHKLSGINPSDNSKIFYSSNVSKAEEYAYSEIPTVEMTYIGTEKNKAGKDRAKLVNKQRNIVIRSSVFPMLRKAAAGDMFVVKLHKEDNRYIILSIHPSGKRIALESNTKSEKIEVVSGRVSLPASGDFCFVDRKYFVSPKIQSVAHLQEGQIVKVKVKQMPDGKWRVISIINE